VSPNPPRVAVITLGCAKNVVDTEQAVATLLRAGFELVDDPGRADIAVLNTCGFIEPAREESIDTLLLLAGLKAEGRPTALIFGGCLSVRHGDELRRSLPEVDRFVGLLDSEEIVQVCTELATELGCAPRPLPVPRQAAPPGCVASPRPRRLMTPGHYAYLKIAEGCSNTCTFCTIPQIRGATRSVPAEELLAEAQALAAAGVRELLLVAQDTTAWGSDLEPRGEGGVPDLAALLTRLGNGIADLEWIRLMYAHPARITDALLDVLAETPRLVPYLDVPVQSGSDSVLRRMGRPLTRNVLVELFDRARARIPDLTLRTSLIVGFPGESEADFEATLELMRRVRFDRLGVFGYSAEPGTPAWSLKPRIEAGEIERRIAEVLRVQEEISAERLAGFVGRVVPVMLDAPLADLPPFAWVGRRAGDAPEVDGSVYLEFDAGTDRPAGSGLEPGQIIPVEIVAAGEHDLEGVLAEVGP